MHVVLAVLFGDFLHGRELCSREVAADGFEAHREAVFLLLAHEAAFLEFLIVYCHDGSSQNIHMIAS